MHNRFKSDWFMEVYTPDMANEEWAQHTRDDIAFLEQALDLSPGLRVLDVACGYGRHAIALAQKGLHVTAIDISPALIELARARAAQAQVTVDWVCADFLDYQPDNLFDVVLNLYDGGIGYQITDALNNQFLHHIGKCLTPGGQHLMHIPNKHYVVTYFPQRTWESTDTHVELHEYGWDADTCYMYETTCKIPFGEEFKKLKPVREGKRVYDLTEIQTIWTAQGLTMQKKYGGLNYQADSIDDYSYISVVSRRKMI